MAAKLTARQQAQLAWLETLPRKFERLTRSIEQLSGHRADETQVRTTQRLLEELKAQASQLNLTPLGEAFGIMATMLRRPGGHQLKVRGLGELLAGAKINYEGALRSASTPEAEGPEDADPAAPTAP
ncbi:MAG: hypothetical protein AB7N73_09710 [Gemmatimonadales bacterium]